MSKFPRSVRLTVLLTQPQLKRGELLSTTEGLQPNWLNQHPTKEKPDDEPPYGQ